MSKRKISAPARTYRLPGQQRYAARKVYIAIPSRLDATKISETICIADTIREFVHRGWDFIIKGYAGVEPISDCRNLIVAEFLASDCTDLIMLDDDLQWQRGAMLRLLDQPVDFVIGVYPFRGDPIGFPVRILRQQIELDAETGLLEVNGGGFGFARLTRSCLERMVAAYSSELEYFYKGCPNDRAWMLFQLNVLTRDPETGINSQMSEDMLFAKRWEDIGGKMWCDTEITFAHIGNKGFVGHYGDWLRAVTVAQREYLAKQAKKAA